MSLNLFEQFDIQKPEFPVPPYGLVLIKRRVMTAEQATTEGPAFCLWKYLTTTIPLVRSPAQREACLKANQVLLAREMDIGISPKEALFQEIMREYSRVNINEMLLWDRMDGEKIAAIALKLGLDFSRGKHPKVRLSEDPRDFMAVPLYGRPYPKRNQTEETLGTLLEIFENVEDQGENISHLLPLLEHLAPCLWRSAVQIALKNMERNMELLDQGVKLVTPTKEPITRESEMEAMEMHLEEARRRIGDRIRDLEERFSQLRTH